MKTSIKTANMNSSKTSTVNSMAPGPLSKSGRAAVLATRKSSAAFVRSLDGELLRLPYGDVFTLRDACAGVHIFGGIGSGKTSGSGKMLAGAYLRAGMGGLVTAVKPEEMDLWLAYAAQHGRASSLLLFDENEGFNFLEYEMARQGIDGTGTVVECLMHVLEAAKRASATASQHGGDAFWEDSARQALRYCLPVIYAAEGSLSIPDIIHFITSAPTNVKEPRDPAWQERSFMYKMMNAASNQPKVAMSREALANAISFWAEQWPAIPEKTRGNVVITITTVLDRFNHGRLQRAFCGRTTVVPELTFHGAVIVLAMPTLTWNEDGVIAQQLFKFMWQRAVLSRNSLPEIHRERPLFLWSDEAQETVNSHDGEFLSMCRGSKCSVVYLTQSLPTYYAKMGGDNPRDDAHALVGKFMTNIFHANACPDTNEYASRVIGKMLMRRGNYNNGQSENFNSGMSAGSSENWGSSENSGSSFGSQSYSNNSGSGSTSGTGTNWGANRGRGTSQNVSHGYSESMENVIEPGEFARVLKTGGRDNGNEVTGVWFQSGRVFRATGMNITLARFAQ
jgi:hypothetical protein